MLSCIHNSESSYIKNWPGTPDVFINLTLMADVLGGSILLLLMKAAVGIMFVHQYYMINTGFPHCTTGLRS